MLSRLRLLLAFVILIAAFDALHASRSCSSGVIYQYPLDGSAHIPLTSSILFRARGAFDPSRLESAILNIEASKSGHHAVRLELSDDRRTLICRPLVPFAFDESVSVAMNASLLGGDMVSDTFAFTTVHDTSLGGFVLPVLSEIEQARSAQSELAIESSDTLPRILLSRDSDATPGTIYVANGGFPRRGDSCYLLNLNEHGAIVKSKMLPGSYAVDFKRQPSGILTFFDYAALKHYALDTIWNIVDSFEVVNGYLPDDHELTMLPNGGYALLGISRDIMDMRGHLSDKDSNVIVQGNVLEIFDRHKHNIFVWRGIDHYDPGDAIHESLDGKTIDFQHANSIDFDSAGNIILSNRHLCEITKIDAETGKMVWRFGGAHNQFRLVNDSIWFSYQHSAELLANGHILMMDNGNFDSVIGGDGYIDASRAIEYALDTIAKTATMVWQFHRDPDIFTEAMGNAQRLPNGNTFIGWGENPIAMDEVKPDGTVVSEMRFGVGDYSYRAFKYSLMDTSFSSVSVSVGLQSPLFQIENSLQNGVAFTFELDSPASVTIEVFDACGRILWRHEALDDAGHHRLQLPGQEWPTGAYFCAFRLDSERAVVRPFQFSH